MLFWKEAYMVPNPKIHFHFVPNFHLLKISVTSLATVWKYSEVQQLTLHMKYSNFSNQLDYCLINFFRGLGQIIVILGYWTPVEFYPCIINIPCSWILYFVLMILNILSLCNIFCSLQSGYFGQSYLLHRELYDCKTVLHFVLPLTHGWWTERFTYTDAYP